jgi:hypothetical protein
MKGDPLKDKSYQFAIRIVKLSQFLQQDKKEFVLSKQVLRSGTAVGALIREAEFGQSRADFTSKMFINDNQFVDLQSDCKELIAMLVSTVKTSKS